MKPLWKTVCFAGCILMIAASSATAQCSSLRNLTYDTIIIGTGNDTHTISLPQFDPSIGTLASAKINSTISVNYGFTLKNVEAVQRDFAVSVGRYDHFSSSALSSAFTNLVDTSIGDFILNPGDSVTKAPYTVLYQYSQNDSITNDVVNFLGSNSVSFDYKPITYTILTGSNVYYYSATANDTIHFSVTYYYCDNSILPDNNLSFSANRENKEKIQLNWSTKDSQNAVVYEIQKGITNTHFSSIGSVLGDNNTDKYLYHYLIGPNDNGKLYFRLKIIYPSGAVKYSEVKMVDISDDADLRNAFVYPNPSHDYINVSLAKDNWDITIYSALGNRIQTNRFNNTSLAHISFYSRLAAGVYFIKAQSITSDNKQILNFVVR
ncbi:MAG TPA: T9SS type A sorting domain-containing protein [Puia sp.]|nr:T9SS type A sorting domain-containing protein [Puia sp.]